VFGFIREFAPRWGSASAGAAPWLFVAAASIQTFVLAFFIEPPGKAGCDAGLSTLVRPLAA